MYEVISVPGVSPTTVPVTKSTNETRVAPNANETAAKGNIGDILDSMTIPAPPFADTASSAVKVLLAAIFARAHSRPGPNRVATKQNNAPAVVPAKETKLPRITP